MYNPNVSFCWKSKRDNNSDYINMAIGFNKNDILVQSLASNATYNSSS